jgi:glycosyltransferase involved in cell wall biosynthesis
VPHSARTLLRTQYGVSESDFLWINVANLRPVKDQATLLRAFALTVKNLPNQKLIILGEGGERTKLESLTRELGLGNSVHLRGAVDDVANFLAAADGCVLSSRSEALPMSLLEAMSYGVPIVATSVGGIPEIISHGVTGLLSPPGESEKLAKYMLEVASDVARAGGLGASAKQYSSKFLAPEVVAIYSGFYS